MNTKTLYYLYRNITKTQIRSFSQFYQKKCVDMPDSISNKIIINPMLTHTAVDLLKLCRQCSSFENKHMLINGENQMSKEYPDNIFYIHQTCSYDAQAEVTKSFDVLNDFISEDEELLLLKEVEPHLKRLHYENEHFDDAIHGYRETEKGRWTKASQVIIERLRRNSFPEDSNQLPQIHVLDLAKHGVIKPHVDSIRFCGDIIAGLCLLSSAVMRLVHSENKDQIVDVLLPRRSLYVMKDASRYKYTHAILAEGESYFGSRHIPRDRRISIMCRNYPIDN